MEKLIMIWDEMDELRAMVPRLIAGVAGIAMIIAAVFVTHL
jgi:hypothetical protein